MTDKITFQLLGSIKDSGGCSGGKCPAIYLGSDGSYYIQGTVVNDDIRTSLGVAAGEDIVCVPATLFKNKTDL